MINPKKKKIEANFELVRKETEQEKQAYKLNIEYLTTYLSIC